jgi:hypothetical protein
MKPTTERSILLAASATAIASVVLATSAWRAVTVGEAEPEPLVLAAADGGDELPTYRALPTDAVELIAENEPFREQRRPSPQPYRMPGDRQPEPEAREAPPPPEPPDFEVVGTVVTADGGLAVIRTAEGLPPAFVGVNQSVGGFRLVSVAADGATLQRGEQTVKLAVADPAILLERPSEERGRNNNSRRQQQQREEQEREALEQQTERLRGLMERAAQGGAISIQDLPPEFREMAGQALEIFSNQDVTVERPRVRIQMQRSGARANQ